MGGYYKCREWTEKVEMIQQWCCTYRTIDNKPENKKGDEKMYDEMEVEMKHVIWQEVYMRFSDGRLLLDNDRQGPMDERVGTWRNIIGILRVVKALPLGTNKTRGFEKQQEEHLNRWKKFQDEVLIHFEPITDPRKVGVLLLNGPRKYYKDLEEEEIHGIVESWKLVKEIEEWLDWENKAERRSAFWEMYPEIRAAIQQKRFEVKRRPDRFEEIKYDRNDIPRIKVKLLWANLGLRDGTYGEKAANKIVKERWSAMEKSEDIRDEKGFRYPTVGDRRIEYQDLKDFQIFRMEKSYAELRSEIRGKRPGYMDLAGKIEHQMIKGCEWSSGPRKY